MFAQVQVQALWLLQPQVEARQLAQVVVRLLKELFIKQELPMVLV